MDANEQGGQEKQKRKYLNSKQRCALFIQLSQRADTMKKRLPSVVLKQTAALFEVVSRTVRRIWALGRNADANDPEAIVKALSPKKNAAERQYLFHWMQSEVCQ